jgi:hypothetical protein
MREREKEKESADEVRMQPGGLEDVDDAKPRARGSRQEERQGTNGLCVF